MNFGKFILVLLGIIVLVGTAIVKELLAPARKYEIIPKIRNQFLMKGDRSRQAVEEEQSGERAITGALRTRSKDIKDPKSGLYLLHLGLESILVARSSDNNPGVRYSFKTFTGRWTRCGRKVTTRNCIRERYWCEISVTFTWWHHCSRCMNICNESMVYGRRIRYNKVVQTGNDLAKWCIHHALTHGRKTPPEVC